MYGYIYLGIRGSVIS